MTLCVCCLSVFVRALCVCVREREKARERERESECLISISLQLIRYFVLVIILFFVIHTFSYLAIDCQHAGFRMVRTDSFEVQPLTSCEGCPVNSARNTRLLTPCPIPSVYDLPRAHARTHTRRPQAHAINTTMCNALQPPS